MKKDKTANLQDSEEYKYIKPCSAQDCTGLIPSAPENETELENYEELYPFLPQIPSDSKYRSKEQTK